MSLRLSDQFGIYVWIVVSGKMRVSGCGLLRSIGRDLWVVRKLDFDKLRDVYNFLEITVLNFRLFVSFHGTLETYPEGWAIGPLGEGLDGCGYS